MECVPLGFSLTNKQVATNYLTSSWPLIEEDLPRLIRYPYKCSRMLQGCRVTIVFDEDQLFIHYENNVYKSDPKYSSYLRKNLTPKVVYDCVIVSTVCIVVLDVIMKKDTLLSRLSHASPLLQLAPHLFPVSFKLQEYADCKDVVKLLINNPNAWQYEGVVFTPSKLPYRIGVADANMFHVYSHYPWFVTTMGSLEKYNFGLSCHTEDSDRIITLYKSNDQWGVAVSNKKQTHNDVYIHRAMACVPMSAVFEYLQSPPVTPEQVPDPPPIECLSIYQPTMFLSKS